MEERGSLRGPQQFEIKAFLLLLLLLCIPTKGEGLSLELSLGGQVPLLENFSIPKTRETSLLHCLRISASLCFFYWSANGANYC